MAGFNDNYRLNVNYWQQGDASYNFDVPTDQFGQELNFQSFGEEPPQNQYSSSQMYDSNPYLNPTNPPSFQGSIFTPSENVGQYSGGENFDDEPPLLEELGINPEHIFQKTLSVLNPLRSTDAYILQDADLAGPLVFCIAFGAFLLLSGKVHFNYIYGIGTLGCLGMYGLLALMATSGVTFGVVVSVMGYCLLPMVALSGINIVFSLQGFIGLILTCLAILWCSVSASKLFVTALAMEHQQPLVAYPCALVYAIFALITVF